MKALDSTSKNKVYETIKEGIQRGTYQPGQQLRIAALARMLDVSQTPVREALMLLEGEGSVVFEPYKGAMVKGITQSEAREIFGIRMLLESAAIERAVFCLSDQLLKEAREITNRMREAKDPWTLSRLNWEFHSKIYRQSGMPILCDILDTLWSRLDRYSRLYYAMDTAHFERDHQKQLEAYIKKDVQEATRLLREHMQRAIEILVRILPE